MAKMRYYEAQELACAVLGLNYDDIVNEGRENEIDEKLYEKFEIGIEQFQKVAEALVGLTPIVTSDFSDVAYHAFGKVVDDKGSFYCLFKSEFDPQTEMERLPGPWNTVSGASIRNK